MIWVKQARIEYEDDFQIYYYYFLVQLDHQRALKHSQAFEESIGRKRAEAELSRAMRIARENENSFNGQIGSLKERIMFASDELQRSIEERSIMQSKLQHAQSRIDQMTNQLRDVELSRSELERQKSKDAHLEHIKHELEREIRAMKRELEQAKESERALNETVNRVEGRGNESRREIMELERELRSLRAENSLLQSKLTEAKINTNSVPIINIPTKTNPRTNNTRTFHNSIPPSYTPISIPVINVPNSSASIPLEIADDSPIVRRGKRLSNVAKKDKADDSLNISDIVDSVVKSPTKRPKENSLILNNLSRLLEGVGKKKIKLPERGSNKITISSQSNLVPSTPSTQQQDIPRSIPTSGSGRTVDPSIMSNFTFQIPSIKK